MPRAFTSVVTEYAHVAFPEFVHHAQAVCLLFAAVHNQAFDLHAFHGGGYPFRPYFGAHEHEYLVLGKFAYEPFEEEQPEGCHGSK